MGSTGGDCIKIAPSDAAGCSETTVEIKIKTLDSETFTLRVDKRVPVPELKEQIASVTGVLSEQQRLICRGKVLKDDQLLSAYHVEDGHTLHMIVRQPVAPSPELSDHPGSDPASSTGNSPGSRVGPGMLVGTFNISEQGDGAFPDLNRIVSAVLNSFGVSRSGSGSEGIDLNQPPLERLSTIPGLNLGSRTFSRQHADQAASTHVPVEPLQPPIIPDSLTTLSQYLSHLRQEFVASAGGHSANARSADLESEASAQNSEARGLLTPESLAEVMSSTRQLLVEQATECLSQLAMQLESHSSVADPLERSRIQSNALRSGALFQNLGALLLELGRTMMTLRMGQSSGDALVNAGPAVFVSSTGPNPIMVQPLPFQPGASFGSVPVGTVQHGSGLSGASAAGTGFLPRNIDIRIRTGSLFPRREQSSPQPQGEAAAPVSSNNVNSTTNQQESAAGEANPRSREPQLRAIPIRTVVAAVPASVARNSDSSRGSIGILYPVLARVQHMSSGNSNGTTSQAMDVDQLHVPNGGNSEQPGPDSSSQQQNAAAPGGNAFLGNHGLPSEALNGQEFTAQIRGGLEHLLSSIFPGEHIPSHTEPTQESGSAVSDQGLMLSNMLRHIIPIVSENTGAESNGPTSGGANPDEMQADGNPGTGASSRRRRGPQTHPNSKRPRREQ